MNVNHYTLNFNQDSVSDAVSYMPLFRYLLTHHQYNLCPHIIHYQPNLLELIDGEVFAHRLGLVIFKVKEGKSPIKSTFTLKNDSDQDQYIFSEVLSNEYVEPINNKQLLIKLPPHFSSELTIEFEYGRGSSHARFSGLEGYRLNSKDQLKVEFELSNDTIDESLTNLKNYLRQ